MHALEEEIRARILSCADTLRAELEQRASSAELNVTDFVALGHLIRDPTTVSPTDLAHRLECSRANVTKILIRLERAGYITAHRIPWAPRAKTLKVTESGRDIHARATNANQSSTTWSTALTKKEAQTLCRLLARLEEEARRTECRRRLRPRKRFTR